MSKGERTVLPSRYGGGPHGLGDPDDKKLRKVEKEVLIPQKMRDKAKSEKCVKEVEEFGNCVRGKGVLMVFQCREENNTMKECYTKWYNDEGFKKLCTDEYLYERSEYRRTGIPVKRYSKRVHGSTH